MISNRWGIQTTSIMRRSTSGSRVKSCRMVIPGRLWTSEDHLCLRSKDQWPRLPLHVSVNHHPLQKTVYTSKISIWHPPYLPTLTMTLITGSSATFQPIVQWLWIVCVVRVCTCRLSVDVTFSNFVVNNSSSSKSKRTTFSMIVNRNPYQNTLFVRHRKISHYVRRTLAISNANCKSFDHKGL